MTFYNLILRSNTLNRTCLKPNHFVSNNNYSVRVTFSPLAPGDPIGPGWPG